ncbi:hypothetical protein V5O48_018137, partial [Marasmius crinis-equi]
TRQGSFYSPYTIDNDVTLDALLFAAANREDDPFGSPLSTPPSSRPPSPVPEDNVQGLVPEDDVQEPVKDNFERPPVALPPPTPPTLPTSPTLPTLPTTGTKRTREEMEDEGSGSSTARVFMNSAKKEKISWKKARNLDPEEDRQASKARGHRNRKRKRQDNKLATSLTPEQLAALAKEHGSRHYDNSQEAGCSVNGSTLGSKAASSGYVGNPKVELPQKRVYRLDELVNDGHHNFSLVKHKPDCTQPIPCPKTNKIMALVVPGPRNDPTWRDNCTAAKDRIKEWRPLCKFPDEDDGRRGGINGVGYGISLGSGQNEPMIRDDQPRRQKKVMELIRADPAFRRIAGFLSITFLTWAPLLFLYYATTMGSLFQHYPHLELPFDNAIWASFAVNFGPRTVCLPHRDSKNLAYGWCAITALGDYNWRKGGHLVLWDLKVVIEFPPGSTIYVPSALVCHFNTDIAPHEERYSFTLYSAGGLFRWVEHGFQFEYDYKKSAEAKENAHLDKNRWQRGQSMFSTLDELKQSLQNS